jgi:NADH dehydrogenase
MAPGKVTVFGGTGFLGQRVVQRLLERNLSVRVAVRHPERTAALSPPFTSTRSKPTSMTIGPLRLQSRASRAS